MRSAERIVAWSCVAAALLGGCKRWRDRGDAGAPDAGPRGPAVVQLPPTEERWQWVGTLHPGADGLTGAVLLLHQLGSSRAEWQPLVERLQRPPAVTVLSLDMRGHGDSVKGPQSDRQTWEGFGEDPARWAGLPRDAAEGARYLFSAGAARSVVVGSGLGASAAVAGLADEPRVVGLAMISPGVGYHGVDALGPMRAYAALPTTPTMPARTAWLMAAERDGDSARAVGMLATEATGIAVERAVVPGSDAHGVSLLNADTTRWDALERYVRTVLHAPRRER